jgi:glycosyltransferase involved in cell wall biosynthesis
MHPDREATGHRARARGQLKILVYSPVFHPSVGGLEFMALVLAEEFSALGQDVLVVTTTADPANARFAFDVARSPSACELVRRFRWSDVVLQMNMSLRGLWPFAFVRRPLIVGHYGFYRRDADRLGVRDRLKYRVSRLVTNVACSNAVKADLPPESIVIGNAYDDTVFFRSNEGHRDGDLVFVGRLVSEKGADLLLQSIVNLKARGIRPKLTLVGFGPEDSRLREFSRVNQLEDTVVFHGKCGGAELAALLNRHQIMVVPSRNEGFGVVALEGIASGCVVVGSDAGGLPEAIGECGIVFRNGDVAGLTDALGRLLSDPTLGERYLVGRARHVARYTRRQVAMRYLEVIESALRHARRG